MVPRYLASWANPALHLLPPSVRSWPHPEYRSDTPVSSGDKVEEELPTGPEVHVLPGLEPNQNKDVFVSFRFNFTTGGLAGPWGIHQHWFSGPQYSHLLWSTHGVGDVDEPPRLTAILARVVALQRQADARGRMPPSRSLPTAHLTFATAAYERRDDGLYWVWAEPADETVASALMHSWGEGLGHMYLAGWVEPVAQVRDLILGMSWTSKSTTS